MDLVDKVKVFFQTSSAENLDQKVPEFYDAQVEFTDPVHHLKGEPEVRKYYAGLYKNVKKIRFDFTHTYQDKDTVIAVWTMTLETPKLKGGEPVSVDGNSVIRFNSEGKAIYHRDYFDMGAFLYENIPGLGYVIRTIKNRMKND